MDHLVGELINSELDYVNDLYFCQSVYILPLSGSLDVGKMFIEWDSLIQVHETLLSKLFESPSEPKSYSFILYTFREWLASLVDLYIKFCSHQNESTRYFEAKIASDIRFKQMVSECQRSINRLLEQQVLERPNNQERTLSRAVGNAKLPLTSFLLKPMQRITKYSLIFSRIQCIIEDDGPHELQDLAVELKNSANRLCTRVNEACRLKEDNEVNKRKLRWAQTHIMQKIQFESSSDQRHSVTADMSLPHQGETDYFEFILFDSKTNCLGWRQFVRSGSVFKLRSNKELVLFLFNDLLLMTQVKGCSSLRVEDVFVSERAQQLYYKIYRSPILLEDIELQSPKFTQTQSIRSSWSEQQLLAIKFIDKSTTNVYEFMALNAREKSCWCQELEQKSVLAREARSRYEAMHISKPIRRPNIGDCIGRLFITVLSLVRLAKNQQEYAYYETNSLDTRKRKSDFLSPLRIYVQLQLKRLIVDENVRDKRELVPTSEKFKTKIYFFDPNEGKVDVNGEKLISPGRNCSNMIKFIDESTQFFIESNNCAGGLDLLEIGMLSVSKISGNQLIGRLRIKLDELLSIGSAQGLNNRHLSDLTDIAEPIGPHTYRPFETALELKLVNSAPDNYDSVRYSYSSKEHAANQDSLRIRLRLHLQPFQSENII